MGNHELYDSLQVLSDWEPDPEATTGPVDLDLAYVEGWEHGEACRGETAYPSDCPYGEESEAWKAWHRGYKDGIEDVLR